MKLSEQVSIVLQEKKKIKEDVVMIKMNTTKK
jgi:hypothetical protein